MIGTLSDRVLWHRLQFAFAVTYHYLFPQLTMGLAWFIVWFKWRALRREGPRKDLYTKAARLWTRIFGLTFSVGVVTGIPMEFQFGTNWGDFSKYAGGVIGRTLAMEGMFAFFLESAFIGVLLYGERRLSPPLTCSRLSASPPGAGSRATSSSSPTPSCSIRWGTRSGRTAGFTSPISAPA